MTRFTFGVHEDPHDPEKELRRIAGSLVVNAETRRFSHGPLDANNHHIKLYYVRDVAREVFLDLNPLFRILLNLQPAGPNLQLRRYWIPVDWLEELWMILLKVDLHGTY